MKGAFETAVSDEILVIEELWKSQIVEFIRSAQEQVFNNYIAVVTSDSPEAAAAMTLSGPKIQNKASYEGELQIPLSNSPQNLFSVVEKFNRHPEPQESLEAMIYLPWQNNQYS